MDYLIANSRNVANRIHRYFRRESVVIYPPVDTAMGYLAERHEGYYLSVSRLDKDKGIDYLIQACNKLKRKLLIVGTGREERRLRAMAGPSISFLGKLRQEDLVACYAGCRALLFAADEDFGLVPIEAQSFGRPVVAFGHGGSLETVRVGDPGNQPDTGIFFFEQTADAVMDGIVRFESCERDFMPKAIQEHARQFDTSVFVEKMHCFVNSALKKG